MKKYLRQNNLVAIFDIYILLFLLSGCSGQKKDGSEMKYVYTRPSISIQEQLKPVSFDLLNGKYVDFYDNLDSLRILKLETTGEAIIGRISRLFIVNDTLFVADYSKAKAILAFDLQGKFLYKISRVGNGPGEYQSINMVQIDHRRITILDWLSWKIIQVDLQGNFLSEKKIEQHPVDFIGLDDDKMLFAYAQYTPETPYQIVFADTDSKPVETAFPFKNTRQLPGDEFSFFQKTEAGKILYHYPLCDTIFEITDKQITPKYHLSLYAPSEIESFYEETKNMVENDFVKRQMTNDFILYFRFIELDDVFYINYSTGQDSYTSLVSKKDYISYNSLSGNGRKKFTYTPFFVSGFNQNALLAFIDETFANFLTKENKELFYSHFNDNDIQKIKELETTDNNPVICILYVKKSL
ncbi:MAG: 6-bladed beta-propeller [Prevotellaceae bacterium]|nr:6-bladed beta-propeller [Prevotellaceae bacterium]